MNKNTTLIAAVALACASTAAQTASEKEIAACANKDSDAERLICYDDIAADMGVDEPSVSANESSGSWRSTTSTSPVDDSKTVLLLVDADEPIPSRYGMVRPTLMVRCRQNRTTIFINWDTYLGIDSTSLLTRIDKEKARTRSWTISTNNKAAFYPANDIGFIKSLYGHRKLLAQVTPYGENPVMSTFDITGLKQAIKPLRKACHW